jgi:antitoxin ParD1/3/4
MNLNLPESIIAFIDEQVAIGSYATREEYISELIRRDQKACAEARLKSLLIEGLDSGDGIPVTSAFWASLRDKLATRRAQRLES